MKEDNVDDDGREQGEGQGNVAVEQEENGRDDLEEKDHDEIVGDKEGPNEIFRRSGRRRRHGKEVEEAVQSEEEKDEAEQKMGDDSNNFHVTLLLFGLKHIEINIIYVKLNLE